VSEEIDLCITERLGTSSLLRDKLHKWEAAAAVASAAVADIQIFRKD